MINLAIALAAGVASWLLTTLVTDSLWAGLLPFLVLFPGLFIFLGRKTNRRIEAVVEEAQKQMMQVQNARTPSQREGMLEKAIDILKKGYAYQHHQFLVGAQLNAQIGQLYYLQKKFDEARPYLEKSYRRNGVAVAMLACLHYMKKRYDEMEKVFARALKDNPKESLLWNLYAWCQWKRGQSDTAMKVLNRGLEKLKDDERIKGNLEALQNNKKMKMRGWKEMWYQFHLEAPPQPKPQIDRRAMFRGR